MIPTVGRTVHVQQDTSIPCRAAVICGLDYGAGKDTKLYLSVFHPYHNSRPVSLVMLTLPSDHWHDPRECPEQSLLGERNFEVPNYATNVREG